VTLSDSDMKLSRHDCTLYAVSRKNAFGTSFPPGVRLSPSKNFRSTIMAVSAHVQQKIG